jgi:hypothetical protein
MGCRMEGPDGIDPTADRMNACQISVSNHDAGRDDGWQNLWLKIKMSGGRSERNAGRGAGRVPDGARRSARQGARRGQTGCLTGLDGVPDGSHVIGHVIFECHVTRLGWQVEILLPTLLSQC